MRNLPLDPEVVAAGVGIALVCVLVGIVIRLLLTYQQYIAAAAVFGMVLGVLVYFDGIRRRPA